MDSCCRTSLKKKKTKLYALFMIGHNCLLLITSASGYQYPLPSNSLVYLYWRKHCLYRGSPNYITCHADLLTEIVKNAFTRHSSAGTHTDRGATHARPWQSMVFSGNLLWKQYTCSFRDRQGARRVSCIKHKTDSLQLGEGRMESTT